MVKGEVEAGRVVDILNEVKSKAEVDKDVKVLVTYFNFSSTAYIDEEDGKVSIIISRKVLKWPDDALRGLFGHELGHLVFGHTKEHKHRTKSDFDSEQALADACAIVWVGREALVSCFKELEMDKPVLEERLARANKILETTPEFKRKLPDQTSSLPFFEQRPGSSVFQFVTL
ncbi:MAG: M48 family metalloprotease [Candidatus Yanofskybacteria bacterium]|nr:M48 family metalloprotease [Candidatus Yanofskybacteria bacterium]